MDFCNTILFFLLVAVVGTCYGQVMREDSCNQYVECDDCIGKGVGCVWCPDNPPFTGPRCTSPDRAKCSSELEDPVAPPPEIQRDDEFSETIQILPQEIRLYLRKGEPKTFTLSVKPARNYPLDMYFLMDLSASQSPDLETLRNLSESITRELGNISSQFSIGFGSFVDKIAYPFASTLQNGSDYMTFHLTRKRLECANGRATCEPTYVYRHHLKLTENDNTLFTEVLEKVTLRGNLDAPEATLDALMQSVVCPDEVGWRNGSLRIVMVLTDAGFKTALDGKVAAILTRNDGECHLKRDVDERFYEYSRDPEQDFPSIYQVLEKLIENDIITIFSVAKNITGGMGILSAYDLYSELADEIGRSRVFVQTIRNDSSDIVSVIRQAYETVTRDVIVESSSGLAVSIDPIFNCNLTSDSMGCANVGIGEEVRFNVTVTMDQCLPGVKTKDLCLPGFGEVKLTLVPICDCNCTSQVSKNHEDCSSRGNLVCGICDCSEGYGDQCDCDNELGSCEDDCFNRGECDKCMRQCISCDTYKETRNGVELTLGYYGERCECDNSTSGACPVGSDIKLACSGRGECICSSEDGMCGCNCHCKTSPLSGLPYSGNDCGCDPDYCYNTQFPNKVCAHNQDQGKDGHCVCGECVCFADSVHFNGTCIYKEDLCDMFLSCARCWPMNCTTGDCHPSSLSDIVSHGVSLLCQFERDGCTVDYQVTLSPPFRMAHVFVGEERDCQNSDILGQLAWIIPVSIVGGILVLGVLLLIVVKCILVHQGEHIYETLDTVRKPIFKKSRGSCCMSCKVTVEKEYETPEAVYETVDDVSGSNRIGNVNCGVRSGARGVDAPDTSDNLAYGVTKRVVTTQNPAYETIRLQ